MGVEVREAVTDDRLGVRRVLDAAMLDVRDDLSERIETGDVLVASEGGDGDAPILGALVLVGDASATRERVAHERDASDGRDEGAHVDAVAVRRSRRGQGIGSALVRAAVERHGRLTAEFDADVRPFYESLGFDVEPVPRTDDRFRGRYESAST